MARPFHRFQLVPTVLLVTAGSLALLASGLPDPTMFQPVSAKVWPYILSAAMAVCALFILVENTHPGTYAEDAAIEEDEEGGVPGFIFIAVMLLAVPGLIYLGFLITSVLVLAACGILVEGLSRPVRLALTAICLPLGIYLLLTRVVGQYLPPPFFM